MYGGNQQYPPAQQQSYSQQQYAPQQQYSSAQQQYPPQQQYSSGQQQYPPQQQYSSGQQQYPPQQQYSAGQQQYPPQQQYSSSQQQYPQSQQYPPPSGGYPGFQQYSPAGLPPYGWQQPAGGQQSGYPQGGQQYAQAGQQSYGQQQYGQQGYGGAVGATQPIVGAAYCVPQEQVFFLSESLMSVSGDDFTIKDSINPAHFYKLNSSALSMRGARTLKDSNGKAVLHMHHKVLSGKLWYISRGSSDKDVIAEVKKPLNNTPRPNQPATCEIYLKGNSSHHFSTPRPDFFAQGDVRGKAFMVYRGQQPVAEISRQLAAESGAVRLTGKDRYSLKVFPNQDAAFLIAVCLIIDELFFD